MSTRATRSFGSAILLRPALVWAVACLSGTGLVHAQLTLTLTPSDHNGYNVSCFGGGDGAIDLTVTGGTPPYTYAWTTGATTQNVTGLRAGFISVLVRDAGNNQARADRTLTEPNDLLAEVVPYLYPSGFNISCVSCYNGSIQVTTTEGVPPYSYVWTDGPTTEDRAQLDAGSYQVNITDANGCHLRGPALLLTQPERDDWSKAGNAGTDPATQFIGTTDNKDVVFKSNGAERLRLKSDGDIRLQSLASTGMRVVYADQDGTLRRSDWPVDSAQYHVPWYCGGNVNVVQGVNKLGPINPIDLVVITGNGERMRVTTTGKVGIGTVPPSGAIEGYRLFVEDGIVARDVLVTHDDWPDYVFAEGYRLMPLSELRDFLKAHSHLPGLPSVADLALQGGVALGTHARNLTRTVEEQTLYILQLEEKLVRMEQRLKALEASQH